MSTVLLVVHLMIAAALVAVVLLQRSEGGALGMGGGGGGFMTGRGTANLLTRITAMLAAAFFVTSLSLTLLAQHRGGPPKAIVGETPSTSPTATPSSAETPPATSAEPPSDKAPSEKGGVLDRLKSPVPVLPPAPN